jgi:hypothetical protein
VTEMETKSQKSKDRKGKVVNKALRLIRKAHVVNR